MDPGLKVTWSSAERHDYHRKRVIATSAWALFTISQAIWIILHHDHSSNHSRGHALWFAYKVVLLAIQVVAICVFAIQSRARISATKAEQARLEDDSNEDAILAEADFHYSGKSESDRGILTVIDRDLVFVGDRSSCRIDLTEVELDLKTIWTRRDWDVGVDFKNGDRVNFSFLGGRYDRSRRRRAAVVAATKSAAWPRRIERRESSK